MVKAGWRQLTDAAGDQPGSVSQAWASVCLEDDPEKLRIDPYLVWSDLTKFDWTWKGRRPRWLPFLIETTSGVWDFEDEVRNRLSKRGSAKEVVLVPTAYRRSLTPKGVPSRFLTALVHHKSVLDVARLGTVVRMKLGLARKGGVDVAPFEKERPPPYSGTDRPAPADPAAAGKKLVLGVIDDGCNFAHQDYRAGPGSRVVRLWDQNDEKRESRAQPADGSGCPSAWSGLPVYLGYGQVLAQADIQRLLATHSQERSVYEALYPPESCNLEPDESDTELPRAIGTHGTGAMHLLAGACHPLPQVPTAPARPPFDTDVMFVQLPGSTVSDTSSGSLCVYALDAIRYIVDRAETYAPFDAENPRVMRKVVINLSYGSMSGPHDGSSVLDAAIDELVDKRGDLAVVVAAGNSRRSQCHAVVELKDRKAAHVGWAVHPSNVVPSVLEIWVPDRGVQVQLTDPFGRASGWASPGQIHAMREQHGDVAWIVSPLQQAVGAKGYMFLLALAPTAGRHAEASHAAHGTWQVSLCHPGGAELQAQVWVERNDMARGPVRRQQSHLVNWDRPVVVTEGTMCSPAAGPRSVAVAAKVWSSGALAPYSAEGWPAHKQRPESAAAVDLSPGVKGMRVGGVVTGSSLRMSGTSAAAPLVARELAAWMLGQSGSLKWPDIETRAKQIQ